MDYDDDQSQIVPSPAHGHNIVNSDTFQDFDWSILTQSLFSLVNWIILTSLIVS